MKKRSISFLLFLLLCFCLPCIKVEAKSNTESRLSVEATEIYVNKRSIMEVTYANRLVGEELKVKSSDDSILKVKLGKWNGDIKNVIVIPQKEGNVTLTITGPKKEKIKVVVYVLERKQLTGSKVYKNCSEAVVEVVTFDAAMGLTIGSGFFINGNMVVTNYHVIDCANKIQIRDCNGKMYEVETVYDYSKEFDLAVLGIKENGPKALICDFSEVETGMDVYAIGSPLSLTSSISEGIVSKAYRNQEGIIYHQNTASISQNSGGGPLLNIYGEVIGINTSRIIDGQNINFSLDINYLNKLNLLNKKPIEELYKENAGKVKESEIFITIP